MNQSRRPAIFIGKKPRLLLVGGKDQANSFSYGQTGEAQVDPSHLGFLIFAPHGAPEQAKYVVLEDLKLIGTGGD